MIIIKKGQKIRLDDTIIPNGKSKLFYIENTGEKFAVTNENGKFSFWELKAPEVSFYKGKKVVITKTLEDMNMLIIDKQKLIDFILENKIIHKDDESFMGTIIVSDLLNFLKISTAEIYTKQQE